MLIIEKLIMCSDKQEVECLFDAYNISKLCERIDLLKLCTDTLKEHPCENSTPDNVQRYYGVELDVFILGMWRKKHSLSIEHQMNKMIKYISNIFMFYAEKDKKRMFCEIDKEIIEIFKGLCFDDDEKIGIVIKSLKKSGIFIDNFDDSSFNALQKSIYKFFAKE